jgi:hypothetical protein
VTTGYTIQLIYPYHNPNEGREIINNNFRQMIDLALSGFVSDTILIEGDNMNIDEIGMLPRTYNVALADDIYVQTVSASTLFSGSTDLSIILSNLVDSLTLGTNTSFTGGQVEVSATGTNNYIGVSTPTITGYSTSVIYLTNFQNGNTGASTININNLGAIPIIKYDSNGSVVDIDAGDLKPNVITFLVFNGVNFQAFVEEPVFSPLGFTNLNPVPFTLGGIQEGVNFNNVPIVQVLNDLLYPNQGSLFSSFSIDNQNTFLEVGDSIQSGNKAFSWESINPNFLSANTTSIRNQETLQFVVDGLTTTLTNSYNFNLPFSITKTEPGSYVWRLSSKTINNSTVQKDFSVFWRHRIYYGTSSSTILSAQDALNLISDFPASTSNGSWSFPEQIGYKYFLIPSSFDSPDLFSDFRTNIGIVMADENDGYTNSDSGSYNFKTLNITNQFGLNINYKVYRTKYSLGSEIKINVK